MTYEQLLSLARHTNNKMSYYLDRMGKYHYTSGKYIDASVRFEQYSDYLQRLIREAFDTMPAAQYRTFVSSIA